MGMESRRSRVNVFELIAYVYNGKQELTAAAACCSFFFVYYVHPISLLRLVFSDPGSQSR